MTELSVRVADATLHGLDVGTGPPCLMPASAGTAMHARMTEPLAARWRMLHVDLRGGGRSSGDPAALDFATLADDLDAMLDAAGIERAAVLGYSVLGILAIEYALRRPERVSHLLLAGTPPRGDMAWLAAESRRFFDADASAERRAALEARMAALGAAAAPLDTLIAQTPMRFHDAQFDAAPLWKTADMNPALIGHLLGSLTSGWDVAAVAPALTTPTLIVHGRSDFVVPYRLWDPYLPALASARFELLERSGHQPFFEQPDEFVAIADDFRETVAE